MNKYKVLIGLLVVTVVVGVGGFQVVAYKQTQQQLSAEKLLLDNKEEKYNQVVKTIKQSDWSKAKDTDWENLNNTLKEISGYKDESVISMYVSALKYYIDNKIDIAFGIIRYTPKDYNGSLKDEVAKLRSDSKAVLVSEIEEQYKTDFPERLKKLAELDEYELHKDPPPVAPSTLSKPRPTKPEIGMSADEAYNTTMWGKPNHINRTTTANGVSEQWVYSSGRYVYVNNAIVTAIQD